MLKAIKARAHQGVRFSRLGVNLLSGSAFIGACYRFPSISKIAENELNDYRLFTYWVKDLVHSMNSSVIVDGKPMDESGLFVSNHISWLDTIVFNHIRPSGFIARHDLEHWPLLGTFTKRMGSIYIDRTNKFQAYRCIPRIEERLEQGGSVHLFPESTTSVGSHVLPFFPMFYEAAVRVGRPVQPVALRYTDEHGEPISEPAFIDDDSFMDTLERMMRIKRIYANVSYCSPLDSGLGRKELAKISREVICGELGVNY
jgi:1-acyl-sn-glycerol-3-phosphate acyltransferase